MQKETTKYVIDSRYFRGSCVTIMSDGTHCDYFGNTLEELREKEGNPYLIALPIKPLAKRVHIYMESLCGPFEEVSEARYYDQLNVLPPIRYNRNSFFMGEPYHGNIHSFYFKVGNRYFTGLRHKETPHEELQRQIGEHYCHINRRPGIEKWNIASTQDGDDKVLGVAYFFPSDRKQLLFICNLLDPRDKESRADTARTLLSLRKHHFLYYKGEGRFEDLDELMDYIRENDYTLLANRMFFQYPVSRESVTFFGSVKETGEKFLYRIYDRDIFLHLLKCLRSVKRETSQNPHCHE